MGVVIAVVVVGGLVVEAVVAAEVVDVLEELVCAVPGSVLPVEVDTAKAVSDGEPVAAVPADGRWESRVRISSPVTVTV